jgi:hypothetical protein
MGIVSYEHWRQSSGGIKLGETSNRAGSTPKLNWNVHAGTFAPRVHDHGMPVSEGELVREMMEWFADREVSPQPDERIVPRKVPAVLAGVSVAG